MGAAAINQQAGVQGANIQAGIQTAQQGYTSAMQNLGAWYNQQKVTLGQNYQNQMNQVNSQLNTLQGEEAVRMAEYGQNLTNSFASQISQLDQQTSQAAQQYQANLGQNVTFNPQATSTYSAPSYQAPSAIQVPSYSIFGAGGGNATSPVTL